MAMNIVTAKQQKNEQQLKGLFVIFFLYIFLVSDINMAWLMYDRNHINPIQCCLQVLVVVPLQLIQ